MQKPCYSKTTLPAAELGRATKGAAYGFEGAAQMWLKNYTAALAAFNNPELTSNYHLLPNFIDVGEYDHQNNDESLFEVQFNAVVVHRVGMELESARRRNCMDR